MTVDKKTKIEMKLWCSDPREFDNLMALLEQHEIFVCVNGKYGGYGFEINTADLAEEKMRKVLQFNKD